MNKQQEQITEFELLFLQNHEDEYSNEIKLWRAVILKAIEDACLPLTNKRYKTWRKQARDWLKTDNEEFSSVCELAKIDKNKILSKLL